MNEDKKRTAGRSFLFKLAESVGTQGVSFVVGLVLARLLSPDDYGVLTLLMVFIALSRVFVQNGFNTALVQKLQVDELDLSSTFYLSLGMPRGLAVAVPYCVKRRCRCYSSTRPVVSGKPSIRFIHWIAAPLAPLPRLSNRAQAIIRSSLPVTNTCITSLPARALAATKACGLGGSTRTSGCPA